MTNFTQTFWLEIITIRLSYILIEQNRKEDAGYS